MDGFNSKGKKKHELDFKEVKKSLIDNAIDLNTRQINVVPVKALVKLPQVTKIDLSNNQISAIPPEFCNLSHITELDLGSNSIEELPEAFGNLVKLERLDLYKNQLKDLPLSFSKLKNLKWLDLKENPLGEELQKVAGDCLNVKECKIAARKVVSFMQEKVSRQNRQHQTQTDNKNVEETGLDKEQNEEKEGKKKRKKKKKKKKAEDEEQQAEEAVQPEKKEIGHVEEMQHVLKKRNRQKRKNSPNESAKSFSSVNGFFRRLFFFIFISSLVGVCFTSYVLFDNCKGSSAPWIPKSKLFCEDLDEALTNYKISSTLYKSFYTTLVSLGTIGLDRLAYSMDNLRRTGYAESFMKFATSALRTSKDLLITTKDSLIRLGKTLNDWYEQNLSDYVNDLLANFSLSSKAILLMLSDLSSFALEKGQLCFAWMTDTINYYASNADEILKPLRK